MNERLPIGPDYLAAIHQTLLRLEHLVSTFQNRVITGPAPNMTMSIAEAAANLGLSRSTTKDLIRTRQLESIRVGRRVLIPTSAVAPFIRQRSR